MRTGDLRDDTNDVIKVNVQTGDAIVDNMRDYFSFYYLRCGESGTREWFDTTRRKEYGDATT